MAQQVKALTVHAWQLEFHPQNPSKGGGREPIPQSCPLTSTCMVLHMCALPTLHTA